MALFHLSFNGKIVCIVKNVFCAGKYQLHYRDISEYKISIRQCVNLWTRLSAEQC